MNTTLSAALYEYLLGMADDELLLGHRNSEWCGHAPILEEDIAFANLALDEIGHAGAWYTLASGLAGEDPEQYPDWLVYFRHAGEYRNLQMLELPRHDWAYSILRQYLFDALERVRLDMLVHSQFEPLADLAAKIRKEEIYHYRHAHAWLQRLGLGTEESHQRLQNALDELWPYTRQPFIDSPGDKTLQQAGYIPAPAEMQSAWEELVLPALQEAGLDIPAGQRLEMDRQQHTPHLNVLLAEMQSLARSEPEAEW
jgi:ring-1,2-phenylacetyl-CoA epoxidase subunit PaaC